MQSAKLWSLDTIVLKEIVVGDSEGCRDLFGNGQYIRKTLVRQFMEFHGVLLRNHKAMASAEGLDIQECITIREEMLLT